LCALVKALENFQNQESALRMNVHKSLSTLQKTYDDVLSRFTTRAVRRKQQAMELNAASVASAKAYVDSTRTRTEEIRKFGRKEFTETAESELAVAEKLYDSVVAVSALTSSAVADDRADDMLWAWYDGLVAHVANSVRDSASLDVAIAVFNGGVIFVGVAFGPVAAAAAAAVSAATLAADLLTKLHKVKNIDKATAHPEGSLLMIDAAKDIGSRWLTLLSTGVE